MIVNYSNFCEQFIYLLLVVEGDLLALDDVSQSKQANFGKIRILAKHKSVVILALITVGIQYSL